MAAIEKMPLRQADQLYEQFGKPLEKEHTGAFLAVATDGRTLLAPTLFEATKRATETFGPGNFVFKVGTRTVGKWR